MIPINCELIGINLFSQIYSLYLLSICHVFQEKKYYHKDFWSDHTENNDSRQITKVKHLWASSEIKCYTKWIVKPIALQSIHSWKREEKDS